LAVVVLTLTAVLIPAVQAADAAGPGLDRAERALLRAINQTRHAHGLASLGPNRRLQRAADAHCKDMLRANFFAHNSSNGTSMAARVRHYRPSHRLGETLAYLPTGGLNQAARRVVDMWMASPPHRAELLSSGFRRIGIARRVGTLGAVRAAVYTADFASSR
jgi:uncharacterized protein YkwD